ncbi:MAG: hypothetical protein K0M45_02560 [Candidatus Paracaedibacteraceae bacterium]|nr:hypothetical protein [Candidatus Paracaedibacteraceae bacterium]
MDKIKMQYLTLERLITTTFSFLFFLNIAGGMEDPSFTAVKKEDLNASHTATPLPAIKKEGESNALAFMDIEKKNSNPASSFKRSRDQTGKDEKETILEQTDPVAKKKKIPPWMGSQESISQS